MLMNNLLEFSGNYYKTSGSLWNDANNYRINNNKTATSKSLEYKTKIIGLTPNNNNILEAEVVILLKILGNFWRSLSLPLINCEIELDLSWSRCCVISEISRTPAVPANVLVPAIEST